MSRLCRLKTKTHGEDGQWAYEEITKLREQVAAQAAEIARLKTVPMKYRRMQFNAELQEEVARLREQVSAQAAVIEKLREALIKCRAHIGDPANFDAYGTERELAEFLRQVKRDEDSAIEYADEALAIPTDSTQILDEVRRAERERVAQMILNGRFLHDESPAALFAKEVAAAIRAME